MKQIFESLYIAVSIIIVGFIFIFPTIFSFIMNDIWINALYFVSWIPAIVVATGFMIIHTLLFE